MLHSCRTLVSPPKDQSAALHRLEQKLKAIQRRQPAKVIGRMISGCHVRGDSHGGHHGDQG
eukprot:10258366-Lingulodinium_polyedra.AAC.1